MSDALSHRSIPLQPFDEGAQSSPPLTARTNAELCPLCGADLQGKPIGAESREAFGATHYSRKIGVVANDRIVTWRCPDCDGEWGRV